MHQAKYYQEHGKRGSDPERCRHQKVAYTGILPSYLYTGQDANGPNDYEQTDQQVDTVLDQDARQTDDTHEEEFVNQKQQQHQVGDPPGLASGRYSIQ